jgi:hypothetical protein
MQLISMFATWIVVAGLLTGLTILVMGDTRR